MKLKRKSWKTSMLGWAVLALTGAQIVANPKVALEERTLSTVVEGLVGVGLIKAADEKQEPSEKTGGKNDLRQ